MEINIEKYSQISYISINETEKEDIKQGVLDILNYVDILKNINIENVKENQLNCDQSIYRLPIAEIKFNEEDRKRLFNNAPQTTNNYFIVPDLIIRKS
jgi:aspartyl/glutamyl-tRNA(Asn/Gln) amidotransferase C subunit